MKYMKLKYLAIFLLIIVPYFFIYQPFFSNSHLVWGDAPYFYPENLKALFNKPLAWDFRNDNFGAPQNYVLWLTLPTFIYGFLNHFFSFSNDVLIRLIFYFPATTLALIGSWLFVGQFTRNVFAKVLGSLLYGFNTYFLMLLDGGQLGFALSYGLFPLAAFIFNRYLEKPNVRNYIFGLLTFLILSNTDIRTCVLAILFILIWNLSKALVYRGTKNSPVQWLNFGKSLIFILIPTIAIDAFWLIPMFARGGFSTNMPEVSNLNLITLRDALLLYQPHFPLNEFGKVFMPPFYFGFIPLLLTSGLILQRKIQSNLNKNYLTFLLPFIIFVFLAKGGGDPFGQIYSSVVNNLPFGSSFRDSSKFFLPLFLTSALLISFAIESFSKVLKPKYFHALILIVYLYLFLLISPAFLGNLTGALSKSPTSSSDFDLIYKNLKNENGFFRTLWFSEKPELAFADWGKPALSANTLHNDLPFASQIEGNYDLFYFLHSPLLNDWLRLLGVKYVFFPPDERKKIFSSQEIANRNLFLKFVDGVLMDQKLPWQVNFPVYEVKSSSEHIFTQNKVIIAVSGEDLYQYLKDKINLNISTTGFIFLEDKAVDSNKLLQLPSQSAVFVHNNFELMQDLQMSFLKKNFIDLEKLWGEWGKYSSSQYLSWKSELLRHNIHTQDIGFGQGLLYSSVNGEKSQLELNVLQKGRYMLAFRHIEASGSGLLRVRLNDTEKTFDNNHQVNFRWDFVGPVEIENLKTKIFFENLGGFKAINAVALINQQDFDRANLKALELKNRFSVYNVGSSQDLSSLKNDLVASSSSRLSYSQAIPVDYEINLPDNKPTWVVFTDHFNPDWHLSGESLGPYPLYSMINGFWVNDSKKRPLKLHFIGQDNIDGALKISFLAGITIAVLLISKLWISKKGLKK